MRKETIFNKNTSGSALETSEVPVQSLIKNEPKDKKEAKLIKLQGILTSEIRFKPKDKVWMAFVRWQHSGKEVKHVDSEICANAKCKKCEIPVVFRIKKITEQTFKEYFKKMPDAPLEEAIIKPDLKKGNSVVLTGKWADSEKSNRPSFTCFSYQILKDHE